MEKNLPKTDWYNMNCMYEWVKIEKLFDKLISTEYSDPCISCPVCGFSCTHLTEKKYVTSLEKDRTEWGNYGHKSVQFYCEDGHVFKLVFNDHKGNVFFDIYGLKNYNGL